MFVLIIDLRRFLRRLVSRWSLDFEIFCSADGPFSAEMFHFRHAFSSKEEEEEVREEAEEQEEEEK